MKPGCQESEPALISEFFSFLLHLSEVKYHWPKSKKGKKTFDLFTFDKEQLDPHGVIFIWSQRKS